MIGARDAIKHVSDVVDRVVPPPAGITILIYHRVGGDSGGAVDLDVDVFRRQLAHLNEHHQVISLDEAVTALDSGAVTWGTTATGEPDVVTDDGRRPVVLTFDDGTTDFTEHVVPALVDHGVPATLYAATAFIDSGEAFPWDAPPTSWSELRDTLSTGLVTIGSHTHSHWLLDRLDPSEIAGDLDRSRDLISDNLGVDPVHFAYPKAVPGSPDAEIAVRRRFRSAALARSRVNRPGHTDLHRLWRTPVQRTDTDAFFAAKANGGLRLEGELRSLLANVRLRGSRQ